MRFIKNIYGFDIWESNYLDTVGAEVVDSHTLGTGGVCNVLFSANEAVNPFLFAWRLQPTVESQWNMLLRQEEYVTVARYGVQVYRPENLVCVLTDTSTVTF